MRKKGFTLIELLVVIAIIAMLLAILMPALNKVKKIAQRVVCGTNLKGLGTAQTVYANDYEDQYTVAGYGMVSQVKGNISDGTGGFNNPAKLKASWANGASIGASLYLLVREADVSPKSFVCAASSQVPFEGQDPTGGGTDITEMWDFGYPGYEGTGPANCVSYGYHHPYSSYAADATKSAAFAVMADRNPWHDPKLPGTSGLAANPDKWMDRVHFLRDDWTDPTVSFEKMWTNAANAQPHDRDGQNVMFGDGHNSYEKRTDVGVRHDGIYTPQVSGTHIRTGGAVARAAGTFNVDVPMYSNDSLLVNDSRLP